MICLETWWNGEERAFACIFWYSIASIPAVSRCIDMFNTPNGKALHDLVADL